MKTCGRKTTTNRKHVLCMVVLFMGYLSLPFFSGLFAWTSDPYGPKIFLDAHHYLLHRAGEFVAGRTPTSKPFYLLHSPPPWFYGMEEKVSDEEIKNRATEIHQGAEAALKRFKDENKD